MLPFPKFQANPLANLLANLPGTLIAALLFLSAQLAAQLPGGNAQGGGEGIDAASPHAGEMRLALKKLNVLASVLYVAAHPDDESTTFLTAMNKGALARTAYLSLTRGEGGQNLIGTEQGAALGILRAEELLAARRIDGAGQFFSPAIDFGYSKSTEEALKMWGEKEMLEYMVRLYRTYRPDVVVTRFSDTIGTHGHHTASAILAARALELSADPEFRLSASGAASGGTVSVAAAAGEAASGAAAGSYLPPWRPKRVVHHAGNFFSSQIDTSRALKLNLGGYNPLLGASYNEISGMSRSMHKSQGFGAGRNRGDLIEAFAHTAGDSAKTGLFDGVDTTWTRVSGGREIGAMVRTLAATFDPENPERLVPGLLELHKVLSGALSSAPADPWIAIKKAEVEQLIASACGLHIEAIAGVSSAAPGDSLPMTIEAVNRSRVPMTIRKIGLPFSTAYAEPVTLPVNRLWRTAIASAVPPTEEPGNPSWLRTAPKGARYSTASEPDDHTATIDIEIAGAPLRYVIPFRHRTTDPVRGQIYRPFTVVPPVSVELPRTVVMPEKDSVVTVMLKTPTPSASGTVRLSLPPGWIVRPESLSFSLEGRGATQIVSFSVRPGPGAASGRFIPQVICDGRLYTHRSVAVDYEHIMPRIFHPEAEGMIVRASIATRKRNIGYVDGPGDEVPAALRLMGYDVTMISDEELATGDLSEYETIVAGIRAYNTRLGLRQAHDRLMEYVSNGGTYIVQYMTRGDGEVDRVGPYQLRISRTRVVEEDAPVEFIAAEHPILTWPNRIGPEDFDGWVQERGLYFADQWDTRYIAVIGSRDSGEPVRPGGMLVARHGRGYYCYTGYSFFRQLPAGVPGAYRLLANLIELSPESEANTR